MPLAAATTLPARPSAKPVHFAQQWHRPGKKLQSREGIEMKISAAFACIHEREREKKLAEP
jgi:hypothetical protein